MYRNKGGIIMLGRLSQNRVETKKEAGVRTEKKGKEGPKQKYITQLLHPFLFLLLSLPLSSFAVCFHTHTDWLCPVALSLFFKCPMSSSFFKIPFCLSCLFQSSLFPQTPSILSKLNRTTNTHTPHTNLTEPKRLSFSTFTTPC